MKFAFIVISVAFLLINCSTAKKEWGNFNRVDCSKYQFGRIEARRLLSEKEKESLAELGIRIQEFVFETQYLGCWDMKWSTMNLEKTAVKNLIPFTYQDKLSSGMQLQELKKFMDTPGESMVLIQTIATVDPGELQQFGKLIFSRQHFYRMSVPHNKLMNLLEFPCIRLLSIIKQNYDPDNE